MGSRDGLKRSCHQCPESGHRVSYKRVRPSWYPQGNHYCLFLHTCTAFQLEGDSSKLLESSLEKGEEAYHSGGRPLRHVFQSLQSSIPSLHCTPPQTVSFCLTKVRVNEFVLQPVLVSNGPKRFCRIHLGPFSYPKDICFICQRAGSVYSP